jgi:hypothetical protein
VETKEMNNRFCQALAKGAAIAVLAFSMSPLVLRPAFADYDHWWFPPKQTDPRGLAAEYSDQTRTVIDRDRRHHITKVMTIPPLGSINGTTLVAYYPGTRSVRLESKSNWAETVATYRRPNGTRDCVLTLTFSMTVVECYDKTGTRLVRQQYWFRTEKVEGGKSSHEYELYSTTEFDAHGQPLREFNFRVGSLDLDAVTEHNVTINGVKYPVVASWYRKDQTQLRAVYWRKAVFYDRRFMTEVDHESTEKIAPPVVPASLLTKSDYFDKDLLPIPPLMDPRL